MVITHYEKNKKKLLDRANARYARERFRLTGKVVKKWSRNDLHYIMNGNEEGTLDELYMLVRNVIYSTARRIPKKKKKHILEKAGNILERINNV